MYFWRHVKIALFFNSGVQQVNANDVDRQTQIILMTIVMLNQIYI